MSRDAIPPAPVTWGLALFLTVLLVERVVDLAVSRSNVRALRAQGAVEYGAGHFPLLVFIHTLFPLSLVAEVVWLRTRPGPLSWF